jgi:DNA-directed RNA polymerase subunit M/transcription elongation factor TFIIS
MRIKDCPKCGGRMGLTRASYDGAGREVIQCGETGPVTEAEAREFESNGYPEPCGHEEPLPADIEAQLENRPRLL